ncbi:MAG TPA: DUF1152 domain-containing protein [Pseudonocardiaceae bacterium]|nr:DUF1152 domain-containing protein [Pseudonocardiaceae bacterium]
MGTLVIAAGGGGDAITGSALARPLGLSAPPVVLTYSWDRLMIDPLPGPRTADDFIGLRQLAPHVLEVLPSTQPISPAGSSLPRLAADLPTRVLLLDPTGGAVMMAAQISAAAAYFHTDHLALIDVGGDVLTTGTDPGLRSPLADQLALAACVRTGLPSQLLITAPGIDGELSPTTILARLDQLGADQLPNLTSTDLADVRPIFDWHPSEASGLLAAAAAGRRGRVEVRDAGDHVELTATTPTLFTVKAKAALDVAPAAQLTDSRSLDEAEAVIREATGISEIRYETDKATRLRNRRAHVPTSDDLPEIDRQAYNAHKHGADFISVRRLSEVLGAITLDTFAALSALLAAQRPDRYEPSLYRTH